MQITIATPDLIALSAALGIDNSDALKTGIEDGAQGMELSIEAAYADESDRWAYDLGNYMGAALALRAARQARR